MSVDPGDVGAARRLGRYAARRRLDVTACPYDPAGGDPKSRALASAWMRGYLHTRPPAGRVDYSDDGET